ncbi:MULTISPECIES: hypothetical protein [Alteribacter]|uniref:Uncharacterized protein n=1 Tax=Alteribacter keqinensis TaxID=2483800 RepID=A0A3M7TXC3_9BACI|nr:MULTISPECIES: hypothetical protein [Alteribacter]MBM7096570.1 hypothetical protein [Alteribacter salitolerans]RNA70226.1 hypothetical protein EBO34_09955 [Alteribacter keqinensis]
MGKPFSRVRLPLWGRRIIDAFYQCLLPIIFFQLIRTLLFPSTFDVILLATLAIFYFSTAYGWFQ